MKLAAIKVALRKPAAKAAALLLVGGLLGWFIGQRYPLFLEDEVDAKINDPAVSCPDRLQVMERERRQSREELAYLKQSVIVEQESCFDVRKAVREKEATVADLNEQLAFYRGIVSPEDATLGVRIHRVQVYPIKARSYQFRLTLLQPVRQSVDAKGSLTFRVEGLEKDRARTYKLEELASSGGYSPDYEFRYYTEVFGQFRLPEGFTPLRIKVQLKSSSRNSGPLSKTYLWEELIMAPKAKESK